jgi:hypothetical protein
MGSTGGWEDVSGLRIVGKMLPLRIARRPTRDAVIIGQTVGTRRGTPSEMVALTQGWSALGVGSPDPQWCCVHASDWHPLTVLTQGDELLQKQHTLAPICPVDQARRLAKNFTLYC